MSVVAISYGACDTRENVAPPLAQALHYECIGREVLQSASQTFNIPETKLSRAIHYTPSLFGMSAKTRDRYVAYTLAAAAEFLTRDNLIYHGPGAPVISQGISHILRVRVIPSHQARVTFAMRRDNMTREKAEKIVAHDEEQRRKWSRRVFKIDESDPKLYDLVIDLSEVDIQAVIQQITTTLQNKKFQSMTYSMQCARNVALAYQVRARLIDAFADIRVRAEDGHVRVDATAQGRVKEKNVEALKKRVQDLPGVKTVDIRVTEDLFNRIAETMR